LAGCFSLPPIKALHGHGEPGLLATKNPDRWSDIEGGRMQDRAQQGIGALGGIASLRRKPFSSGQNFIFARLSSETEVAPRWPWTLVW
jgi:hypothetical protein